MDDLTERRRLSGQHDKLVYEAVKTGTTTGLSREHQLYAQAIREHTYLPHVHNALEFADLREGTPYEITVDGEPVNPIAHVATHSTVKGQIEEDPLVKAAFEKMLATGTSDHHAEHVLGALLLEVYWAASKSAEVGEGPEKAMAAYNRKLRKIVWDSVFRKKLTRKFTADHPAFE